MFTVQQINTAHSKVKSGADFPAYIHNLKQFGVTGYETYVSEGHTDYYANNNFKTSSVAKYNPIEIAEKPNAEQFKVNLKAHQQGQTNYPTFCSDCAKSGIEKWRVRINEMTCTYYDKLGNEILVEIVPTA